MHGARGTPNAGTVRAVLFDSILSGLRRITARTDLRRPLSYQGRLWLSKWEKWSGRLPWEDANTGAVAVIKAHPGFLTTVATSDGGTCLVFCEDFDDGRTAISYQI